MNVLHYGSDFSSYQSPKPDMTGWEFAYVKATEGTTYVNPNLSTQSLHVEKTVKHRGYYHYMQPGKTKDQARFFVNTIGIDECKNPYVELWLDFEEPALTGNEPKMFMDEVKRLTGKQCGLYISHSWLISSKYDWSDLPKDTPLWVAMYPSNERAGNNLTQSELQWASAKFAQIPHFKTVTLWQYGAGSGYDWNARFTPLYKSGEKKNMKEPKKNQIIQLKKSAWLYDKSGNKTLTPSEKNDWLKCQPGMKVKFKKSIGKCFEVEYYGLTLRLRKENFKTW